jgi:putative ABC transport system ATP-binding protein
MIELKNISVIFNKNSKNQKKVLDNISLKFTPEKSFAIRGGNGAGKSTLVKVIAGEIMPSHGKIFINNQNYTNKSLAERAPLIARVFQDSNLGTAADMTLFENLLFASKRGETRGLTWQNPKEKTELFKERLAELKMGLEHKLSYQVKFLSGGERQALSLVMALIQPCQLLILDEHTSALDTKSAKKVMEKTLEVVEKHKVTSLMITHDPNEAALCDRILELRDGQIYEEGDLLLEEA